MHPILISFAAAAATAAPSLEAPTDGEEIVVTGERGEAAASFEYSAPITRTPALSEAAGLPMVTDYLRLYPGTSVATSGPRGSQTQVRLRGAEANHTLLVVDGIRFNDPAAGNEARFELLGIDFADRIGLLLGPRSALWGSEAIGGVVIADTLDPYFSGESVGGRGEYGNLDSARGSTWAAVQAGDVRFAATGAWIGSDGIDSFAGGDGGDRDGFENRSASLKLVFVPGDRVGRAAPFEIGVVGHWIEGSSEYDGFDPVTFRRADTLDETNNRIGAVRGWAKAEAKGWTLRIDGSLLASANRNLLAGEPLNRTFGRRFTASASLERKLGGHVVTAAAEHQSERFRARDEVYFGATRQDRSRDLDAVVGAWEAEWSRKLTTELAVRHDRFSAFADATTVRAGITAEPVRRVQLVAGYGEGIAQPTFYDLYGFFPGSFEGNPALKPERSEGWNAGVRLGEWRRTTLSLGYFRARLRDEIVDVFDPASFRSTTANATGTSRRKGIEALIEVRPRVRWARRLFATYTWLDAEERQLAGDLALREVRRPRHSAGFGGQGELGALSWGATLAYVGARRDTDFESFPARPVRLGDYGLASLQLAWRFREGAELFARTENALGADYQDVFGYRTQGRSVHAGFRLSFRP
ncbi:MAG TPA: TonB-dependent receptor [Allosphingosinicella sp.]|jgi:vitamin B12 transporter